MAAGGAAGPVDQQQRTAALDGLRGLAALMVVASHASHLGLNLLPGLNLAGIGKHGVFLFFAISACLLTAQWLRLPGAAWGQPRTWGRYALRRVARIAPLYALVLAVGWALAPRGLGVTLDGAGVLRHLLTLDGQGIYWSIPVEMHFYLLLPLLAAVLRPAVPLALQAVAVVGLLAAAARVWPAGQAPENSIVLGYYLPVFVGGAVVAALATRREVAGAMPPPAWAGVLGDALLAALLVLTVPALLHQLELATSHDVLHRSFLGWGLAWALVLLALQQGLLPRWQRLLARPGLVACGQWCFGLYLLHMPALVLAKRLPLPAELSAWLGLVLALLLAGAAHRWLERPVQRWASGWMRG